MSSAITIFRAPLFINKRHAIAEADKDLCQRIAVRGCDLWEFADGRIVRKDSYWKRVE